jgi:hypothetical protein
MGIGPREVIDMVNHFWIGKRQKEEMSQKE